VEPTAPTPSAAPDPSTPTANVGRSLAFILLIAGFVAVVGLVSWRANERERALAQQELAASQNAKASHVVHIAVEGMTCAGCAQNVASEIEKVPGVASCTVSLEKKVAEVRLANGDVAPSALVAAVQTAGYTATLEAK
jgi:copper chaperone CopZ